MSSINEMTCLVTLNDVCGSGTGGSCINCTCGGEQPFLIVTGVVISIMRTVRNSHLGTRTGRVLPISNPTLRGQSLILLWNLCVLPRNTRLSTDVLACWESFNCGSGSYLRSGGYSSSITLSSWHVRSISSAKLSSHTSEDYIQRSSFQETFFLHQ